MLKPHNRLKMKKIVITFNNETFKYKSTSTLKADDLPKKINVLEALHYANEAKEGFVKFKENS